MTCPFYRNIRVCNDALLLCYDIWADAHIFRHTHPPTHSFQIWPRTMVHSCTKSCNQCLKGIIQQRANWSASSQEFFRVFHTREFFTNHHNATTPQQCWSDCRSPFRMLMCRPSCNVLSYYPLALSSLTVFSHCPLAMSLGIFFPEARWLCLETEGVYRQSFCNVLSHCPLALPSRTILSDSRVVGLSGCRVVGFSFSVFSRILIHPHSRPPTFSHCPPVAAFSLIGRYHDDNVNV
jgi:hypothetical protein